MIKDILSVSSKKGKLYIVTATLAFIAGGLLSAYLLYLIIEMVADLNNYLGKDQWKFGFFLTGIVLIKMVTALIADLAKHYAGFDVEVSIREGIIKKLKQFSLGFYTKERLGEVTTIIHKDVQNMQAAVGHFTSIMISDIVIAIIIGTYLFFQNTLMGVGMVSLLPVAFILLVRGYKNAAKMQKNTNDCLVDMVSYFIEFTRGMPLLRAFLGNENFETKMEQSTKKFGDSAREQAKVSAKYIGHFTVLYELSYVVMIITGIVLAYNGKIEMGVLLIFIIFSKEFYKPFKKAESYWMEYIKVKDSYKRISRVMESKTIEKVNNPKIPKEFNIEFQNVNFKYEEDEFELKNINAKMSQKTLTALVGASGSGKTTMTNLLLRFFDIDQGRICIGDIDIKDIDYDLLLRNISIVMQNVILFSGSIKDNIMIGNKNATDKEIVEAAKKAQIHEFIAGLPNGYNTIVGENGVGLSGGQRQRLSIARAFLKDAPIVLLDEITSNVDPVNEYKIQLAINELVKNKTVITIVHNLNTIKNADQIIVFDKGNICEKGKHNELLKKQGTYKKLWEQQEGSRIWKIV